MIGTLATLLLIALPLAAVAWRLPKIAITAISLALYFGLLFMGWLPVWVAIVAAIVLVPVNALIYAQAWRQQKFSKPFMQWFKKQLPSLSKAERQALEAGGLWWEEKLFKAEPHWQGLADLPALKLTAEEQSFLDNETEQLCKMLDDWDIVTQRSDMPKDVWAFIRSKGFLSFIIDKEYGGKGFSAYAHSCIVSKIASRSMSAAVSIMVPNSLGPAEFLMHFGTDEQKQKYLPRLAAGQEIPCFGLTAPEAGSDASSITDIGVVCKGQFEGKEVIGVRLNFNKRYITLAPVATLMGIAFKMYDPDHLLGKQEAIGITFALLPTTLPGVEIGNRHWPSQLAFMNGPIRGKDVFVPLDYMLGGEDYHGKGWQMMMECLAVGRGISLPALATAGCQFTARMTANYSQIRQQFSRSIGDFEGIGLKLGQMAGQALLAESTRRFTLRAIDSGTRPSIATAITKYHLTEMSRQSILQAMDIHAGKAVQTGPSNYLHLLYNAAPTAITVEGANILTRNMIIFGQGAMRAHPFIADEIVAAGEGDLAHFDELLMQHADHALRLVTRALGYGLSGNWLQQIKLKTPFKKQLRGLQQMSNALALLSEAAFVVLGKALKVNEAISARLGDILSQLYMATAVLAYYEELQRPTELRVAVEWSLEHCLHEMQTAVYAVCHNFPKRWVGWSLQKLIFPYGQRFSGPKDKLTLLLSKQIQTDESVRNLLSQHVYIADNKDDPVTQMEQAWHGWRSVQPLIKKITAAVKQGTMTRQKRLAKSILEAYEKSVITAAEKEQCDQVLADIWQAIQVDEFEPNQLARTDVHGKQSKFISS